MKKFQKKYSIEYGNTSLRIKTNGRLLCDWLTENFGKYAYGKKIAPWTFSMPKNMRLSLLQGILDSDGYEYKKNHFKVSTVSKSLAIDIRFLAETLGYSTTIFYIKTKDTCIIQGRKVKQKDYYEVMLIKSNKRNKDEDNLHSWYKVKNINDGRKNQLVYNMTVEDDNSYVADGIVVHNCQDMSIAGKRAGLEGNRSNLFYEAIRIIKEMRGKTNGKYPRYLLWENVPGAFSSNGGDDFRCVLEEFTKIKSSEIKLPRPKKWEKSGTIMGDNLSISWRVLDAKYFGVPQRRRRIFIVTDLNGRSSTEILFEQKSLSGNTSESCKERTRNTRTTKDSLEKTVCLNEQKETTTFVFENHGQGSRYKRSIDATQTLVASLGEGGNNQPFVVYDTKDKTAKNKTTEDVYTMSKNSHFTRADKNISSSLVATDYKDPPLVNQKCVRRLTPKECGRLQGFPDYWCDNLEIKNPTNEDLAFWRKVFDKEAEIKGLKKKKTDKQIIKWLKNPHSDSAEYKMWGNGIALPCATYIFKRMNTVGTSK